MKLRSTKGFSLVELIIVIAIMGIIAVVAVPNLTGIQKRSQYNADITTATEIGRAVKIYVTENPNTSSITTSYAELSTLNSVLKSYIGTSYVPKAVSSSKYYIRQDADGYIVVAIGGASAPGVSVTAAYGDPNGTGTFTDVGIAYYEGKTTI